MSKNADLVRHTRQLSFGVDLELTVVLKAERAKRLQPEIAFNSPLRFRS